MIESLRAFGYTLETALADLIDNSIAAGAKNVWLDTEWDGHQSRITLLDDGRGMTEEQLLEAMRPGSQSPLEDRAAQDLGRFGLGLKTASLSQCRCLTVASKKAKGEAGGEAKKAKPEGKADSGEAKAEKAKPAKKDKSE